MIAGVAVPSIALINQSQQDAIYALNQRSAASSVVLEDPTLSSTPVSATAAPSSSIDAKPAAIATLTIPRFGADWVRVVYEGTGVSRVLTPLGVGHYTGTASPGEQGNFAVAAHRAGSGGPFRDIDKFRAGDEVIVKTATGSFTYRYLATKVVNPGDVGVIAPVPLGLQGGSIGHAYLTLTSCTPIHVNTQRIVAWFELVSSN